jgi:hypothetical protein
LILAALEIGMARRGCYTHWLQNSPVRRYLDRAMSSSDGRGRRPYAHLVLVGAVVAASTIVADLAAYVGHPDFSKLITFGLAGLLAAVVALFTTRPLKKNDSLTTDCNHTQHLTSVYHA